MAYLILAFSLLIAALCLYYGIKLLRLNARVRKWPRAWAQVTRKEVVPRKLSSASRAAWAVATTYDFVVNGVKYTGNKMFLVELIKGEKGYLKAAAQKVVDKLPDQVEIYYNPQDPGESVMYADARWMGVLLIVMTGISLLMGLAQIVAA
jgi:hypothetical protein